MTTAELKEKVTDKIAEAITTLLVNAGYLEVLTQLLSVLISATEYNKNLQYNGVANNLRRTLKNELWIKKK